MTFDFLLTRFHRYYSSFVNFIIKDEQNEDVKIKKEILVYHIPISLCYFLLLPFFNPYVSMSQSLINAIAMLGYYFILKTKYFSVVIIYLMSNTFIMLYTCSSNPSCLLRSIGILLIQHKQSMVLTHHKKLILIFIFMNISLVYRSQSLLTQLMEQNDFEQVSESIRSFQCTWPFLYLMNTMFIVNLTKRYCQAFQESQEARNELKAKNQELFSVNEKLKSTLLLLEQTNKDLKDAISARELFIASVSHELRNPLNSMLGNIELLGLELKDPRWTKMLDTCKICGEVLLGLINNILDVVKINAERLELNIQPGNLHKLLEKVWVISTIKMRQQGIKGYLAIAKNVPKYAEVDSHRLNQILLNLIGNATKFTKAGFVKIVVSWYKDGDIQELQGSGPDFARLLESKQDHFHAATTASSLRALPIQTERDSSCEVVDEGDDILCVCSESKEKALKRPFYVHSLTQLNSETFIIFDETETKIQEEFPDRSLRISKEKGILKFEIIDSGCGISQAAIQKLFQPFSQADSSITRHFGGTGLGLYITKQLVHKMGGYTGVDSRKDVGSSFWMVFPTQTMHKTEVEEDPLDREYARTQAVGVSQLRVLAVDDDSLNQMIITNYMKKLGIETETASNGLEAFKKFKAKGPDYYCLITMDIQMPIMDGWTACKAIRRYETEMEVRKNIPIIIVSANCIECEKNQCLDPDGEIKASYFFRKPFTFEECHTSINTLLSRNENSKDNTIRKIKVLIVDDDSFNRLILKDYLERYNFECEVSISGREAVAKVDEQRFDVVLMDCEMPGMDGYVASKLIRAKCPQMMIIGVTGNPRQDCLLKARENGMNDIETKPVNFQRLIKNMISYVNG